MCGHSRHDQSMTQPHNRLPPSFLCMDAWMTSQLNVALNCKLHGSLMCLAYFLTCYLWVFVQPVDWCRNQISVLYTTIVCTSHLFCVVIVAGQLSGNYHVINTACIFLTCYPWVFVQPGISRRLVNWCKN